MKNIVLTFSILMATMSGCAGNSLGNQLGVAWVTHNTTTTIMTQLNDAEIVSLSVAKEFQSYQLPVKAGLDEATDDYLDKDGDFTQTKLVLDMLGPMLDRMTQIEGDSNGTD